MNELKAATRIAAYARRKVAHAQGLDANPSLFEALKDLPGDVISGYWPIRTEADPRLALHQLVQTRKIVLPVVAGDGLPLEFRDWSPGTEMIEGAFGAAIPKNLSGRDPDILIVPLAAFDNRGFRLGYGGGFYDRTLERLRAIRPTLAVGFAYSAQEIDEVPTEKTDQPLDMIVTEQGLHKFGI